MSEFRLGRNRAGSSLGVSFTSAVATEPQNKAWVTPIPILEKVIGAWVVYMF